MTTQCGSYRYDTFESETKAGEFNRLYRQASSLLKVEQALWSKLPIKDTHQILDLGCGSGIVTRELAKAIYPASVVGTDISQLLLEKGEQIYAGRNPQGLASESPANVTFQQGDAYHLPFEENHFEGIYSRLLFQHLAEPVQALKQAYRVLKPGGFMCILDVDNDWSSMHPQPQNALALREAVIKQQRAQGGDPLVGRKLGHYLKESGFSNVKTTVELVDSDRLGFKNFVEMLSLGAPYKSENSEIANLQKSALEEIQALLENPYAWAGFGLFVVTGYKRDT